MMKIICKICANEGLKEIGNFQEKYNLSKLILVKIQNLNWPITTLKIEKEKVSYQ